MNGNTTFTKYGYKSRSSIYDNLTLSDNASPNPSIDRPPSSKDKGLNKGIGNGNSKGFNFKIVITTRREGDRKNFRVKTFYSQGEVFKERKGIMLFLL